MHLKCIFPEGNTDVCGYMITFMQMADKFAMLACFGLNMCRSLDYP